VWDNVYHPLWSLGTSPRVTIPAAKSSRMRWKPHSIQPPAAKSSAGCATASFEEFQ
jgi:hypothetical protein